MKQLLSFSVALIMALGSLSCSAQANKKTDANPSILASKVEVYYFHFERRCMTCNAVEAEAKKSLETLYPEQMKNGSITFTSVNLDEDSSKAIAQKCKAGGQALLIISGDKRTDLTSQGFMNARSNPAKLTEEIRKTVDPLLASK